MTEITNQPVVTQSKKNGTITTAPIVEGVTLTQTLTRLVYFLFGILEVLLVFRLIFKFAGASTASAFVRTIYSITSMFIYPFEGIFRRVVSQGVEASSILEPSTLVAIVVYALVAWGIVQLVIVLSRQEEQA